MLKGKTSLLYVMYACMFHITTSETNDEV